MTAYVHMTSELLELKMELFSLFPFGFFRGHYLSKHCNSVVYKMISLRE